MGESGSGKSTSIKTLNPKETYIVNVAGKELPFRGSKATYSKRDAQAKTGNMSVSYKADSINTVLKGVSSSMPEIKNIVVDDTQYIMAFEFMERAKEKGFDKFVELAMNMYNVIKTAKELRDDITVFFLAHSEDINANGYIKTKMKTIGKMLDEKVTLEGLFSVVLLAQPRKKSDKEIEYGFHTQTDGTTTCKSPDGMFDQLYIPNDLQYVLNSITKYELGN
jgi:ABC-type oligopeptide transport system ATPase subunit